MHAPSVSVKSVLLISLMLAGSGIAYSQQDYPSKPIRIITSAPGGGTDFLTRIVAQGITGPLGQPVLVDNRGGGVIIVGDALAKAPADGYTLLCWANQVWTGQYMQKLPFDYERDFVPITLAVTQPAVLVVHPSLPVKSVKDLITLAKARPGELNYAASGIGGTTHLTTELFNAMAGIKTVRVNYKSTGQALSALVGGETQLMFPTANSVVVHVKSGRLKALAVTTPKPTPLAPNLPTVAATLPGYESLIMTGFYAPARTPATIVNRLNQEIVRVLMSPDVKAKLFDAGSEVVANSQEQFVVLMKADQRRWAKVITDAGIKLEE